MHWFFVAISVFLAPDDAPVPECAGCHPAEVAKHAGSRHAVSWVNPLFRGEYDPRPKAWCVSCHAPDVAAADRREPLEKIAERGVSCQGCHKRDGQFVSRRRGAFSIHATEVDPQFGSPRDCARCHEFNFPVLSADGGNLLSFTEEPMQKTVSEALSHNAASDCTGCHDPHRAAGSHSPAKVAEAMSSSLCLDGNAIVFAIENTGADHHLPSGGVHRFMTARLWRSSSPANVASMRLGREFGLAGARARRTTVDTTIPAGGSRSLRVALAELGGEISEPINADVRYHYAIAEDARLIDGRAAIKTIERRRISVTDLPACAAMPLGAGRN